MPGVTDGAETPLAQGAPRGGGTEGSAWQEGKSLQDGNVCAFG